MMSLTHAIWLTKFTIKGAGYNSLSLGRQYKKKTSIRAELDSYVLFVHV